MCSICGKPVVMKRYRVFPDSRLSDQIHEVIVEAKSPYAAIQKVALEHGWNQCVLEAEELAG